MTFGVSDRGEELLYRDGLVHQTLDALLYLDSADIDGDGTAEGDDLSDSDDRTAVTTVPTDLSRTTTTVQAGDVAQFDGDYGVELTFGFPTDGVSGEVDGVLLLEDGTDTVIARAEITNPEPGPYQSLNGLTSFTVEPRLTTD